MSAVVVCCIGAEVGFDSVDVMEVSIAIAEFLSLDAAVHLEIFVSTRVFLVQP